MKISKQNTLLHDFVGPTFCLMMTVVSLVIFSGCSGDDGKSPLVHEGGYTEETASLENITVAGRALNLSVSAQLMGKGEKEQLTFVSGSAYAEGAQVKFFGVDTATFEVSEESFARVKSDKDGKFEVEKVSPESPFAVVEVSGKVAFNAMTPYSRLNRMYYSNDVSGQATYRTIVDLREKKDVKVNILTTLAAARTLSLAKTGLTFAEAKAQAESDVLLALGIRDSLDAFDKVDYSQKSSSIFPVFIMASYLFEGVPDAVDQTAADIDENGLL